MTDNRFFTMENIKNQFIGDPKWEDLYKSFFPNNDTTPENYTPRAIEIFEKNGCRFDLRRPFSSEKFKSIVEIDLYHEEEFVFGLRLHESQAYGQIIVSAISNYELDFSKFKVRTNV